MVRPWLDHSTIPTVRYAIDITPTHHHHYYVYYYFKNKEVLLLPHFMYSVIDQCDSNYKFVGKRLSLNDFFY